MTDLPPLADLGADLAEIGEGLVEDAFGLISGLLRQLTDAIRESGGLSRAGARRAGPEFLSAHYRRERLTRQYRQTERAAFRGEPAPTARQALGHRGPEDVLPRVSFYAAGRAWPLIGVEVDRRTARRVGVVMEACRRLLDGRLSAADFDRRFSRWAPVVVLGPEGEAGTYRLATAAEVIALAATAGPDQELIFDSGRRRPRRRRTTPSRRRSR